MTRVIYTYVLGPHTKVECTVCLKDNLYILDFCCCCFFSGRDLPLTRYYGSLLRIVLVHPSSISDTISWQSTYSHSLMNIQFTPTSRVYSIRHIYTQEIRTLCLSLCHSISLPPSSSSFKVFIFAGDISSKMRALISSTCFGRGVDLEPFFPDILCKPTQFCTVCATETSHLSFVSTNTLIWGFSLLSKQWLSSGAKWDTGITCTLLPHQQGHVTLHRSSLIFLVIKVKKNPVI